MTLALSGSPGLTSAADQSARAATAPAAADVSDRMSEHNHRSRRQGSEMVAALGGTRGPLACAGRSRCGSRCRQASAAVAHGAGCRPPTAAPADQPRVRRRGTVSDRDAVQAGARLPLKLGEDPPHGVTRFLLGVGQGTRLRPRPGRERGAAVAGTGSRASRMARASRSAACSPVTATTTCSRPRAAIPSQNLSSVRVSRRGR